MNITREVHFV